MKFKLLSLAVVVTAMLVACNGNNNTQQPQPVSNGQQQQVTPAATPENNAAAAQPQPAANAQQALPEAINTFVQQSFPGAKITYTETDQEYGGLEYDVTLDNGTKIDFDRNNQWKKVECYKGVPAALVPQAISAYVKNNFQSAPIIKIDKNGIGYEIELANDIELRFDQSGNFIGTDD